MSSEADQRRAPQKQRLSAAISPPPKREKAPSPKARGKFHWGRPYRCGYAPAAGDGVRLAG